MNSFEVVSDREVIVHYLGNKSYSVMLRGSCPAIKDVDRVSFATGADRYIGERRGYGSVYATPVEYSRVCGRGGERLVFRTRFHDFNSPSPGCLIESIRRIP